MWPNRLAKAVTGEARLGNRAAGSSRSSPIGRAPSALCASASQRWRPRARAPRPLRASPTGSIRVRAQIRPGRVAEAASGPPTASGKAGRAHADRAPSTLASRSRPHVVERLGLTAPRQRPPRRAGLIRPGRIAEPASGPPDRSRALRASPTPISRRAGLSRPGRLAFAPVGPQIHRAIALARAPGHASGSICLGRHGRTSRRDLGARRIILSRSRPHLLVLKAIGNSQSLSKALSQVSIATHACTQV